jgi:hypothetical protein
VNKCRACAHPQRAEIDRELVRGVPLRDVEGRFGISRAALSRHAQHISAEVAAGVAAERAEASEELLEDLAALAKETRDILADPKSPRRVKLAAIAQLQRQLEMRGKLLGKLSENQITVSVNVAESPEWRKLCGVILAALRPYADASKAVREALGPETIQ